MPVSAVLHETERQIDIFQKLPEKCQFLLIKAEKCDKLIMPNQLNTMDKEYFLPWGYYTLFAFILGFDKNADPISMNAEMLVVLNWFGDYRGLRFLCDCFGSRTFLFSGAWKWGIRYGKGHWEYKPSRI